jgi:uncharacterized protein YceH (UPF0502 family)
VKIELAALEARVIGCLIEKQITTPDQYPLSLNALTNACNQKSNRDPLLALSEAEVQSLLDHLVRRHFVLEKSGFGSRVPKYQHCFCNTDHSALQFSAQELALVCELLLRGPQTPGELRSRAARMADFQDASQVEAALEALAHREVQPIVIRLAREPGRRDSRYAHLLSGPVSVPIESALESAPPGARAPAPASDRIATLETAVAELRNEIERLRGLVERSGDKI